METEDLLAYEAKGMWFSPDRVFAAWQFKANPNNPNTTAEEAMNHVRDYMTVGDNEYISNSELEGMGFVRKEQPNE
jgi:hypothetical protein